MYVEYFQYYKEPDIYGYVSVEAIRLQPDDEPVEEFIKYLEIPKYDTGYAYLIAASIEHNKNGVVNKDDFILEFTDTWVSAFTKLCRFVYEKNSLLQNINPDWYRFNIYKFSNDNDGILFSDLVKGIRRFNKDLTCSDQLIHKTVMKYADWYNYDYEYDNGILLLNKEYSGYVFCGSDILSDNNYKDWLDYQTKMLIKEGKLKSPLG